jgi:alkylation response protein AidB-like acyl-CoA dehydrogenase
LIAADDIRWMAQVAERLSRHSHDLASIYMANAILGGALIAVAATKEQKAELLPRLKAARSLGSRPKTGLPSARSTSSPQTTRSSVIR